jgi:hypothetical protein
MQNAHDLFRGGESKGITSVTPLSGQLDDEAHIREWGLMSNPDAADTTGMKEIAPWTRRLPYLASFRETLPRLAEPGGPDFDAAFTRMGELLGASATPLVVRIQVSEGEHVRSWQLNSGPAGCQVTPGDANGVADAEATADAQTWALIVGGALSPLEAFARGRLRLRGSMPVARNVARQLYGQDRQAGRSDA